MGGGGGGGGGSSPPYISAPVQANCAKKFVDNPRPDTPTLTLSPYTLGLQPAAYFTAASVGSFSSTQQVSCLGSPPTEQDTITYE